MVEYKPYQHEVRRGDAQMGELKNTAVIDIDQLILYVNMANKYATLANLISEYLASRREYSISNATLIEETLSSLLNLWEPELMKSNNPVSGKIE